MLAPQGVSVVIFHPADAASKNFGEKLILEALRDEDKHPEIHVYHSVKISQSDERLEGEADFVVLIPNKGIVVVEAKGATHGNYVGDKLRLSGVPDPDTDPFDQVQQIRTELTDYLFAKGYRMPIARCVWLPVITKNQVVGLESDISRNKNELLTAENLANPTESLLNVINAYNNEQFGKKHFQKPDLFNSRTFEATRNAIRAEFEILPDKQRIRDLRETELQDLERIEKKLLSGIERNPHIYFYGPAGTGKSLMLTELAFRTEEAGNKVLLTCWNKMVVQELKDEFQDPYPGIDFIDLGALMLKLAGVEDKPTGGDNWYFNELPKLAIAAAKVNSSDYGYDMIAVDEYQDVASHPIILELLRCLGKEQSWNSTKIVLAGDKYQQIMRGEDFTDDPYALACEYIPGLLNYKLVDNYRNSPRIGKALTALTAGKAKYEDFARNVIQGEIEIIEVQDEKYVQQLGTQIANLQKLYDDDEIRVLSASRSSDSLPIQLFASKNSENIQIESVRDILKNSDTGQGTIPWRSIPKYKGLEADAVIIVDATQKQWETWELKGKDFFEILYVGFSRARHHVVVVCDSFVAQKLKALNL